MATGDKLVTLDGLKAVYDKVDGDVGGLKSAIPARTLYQTTHANVLTWTKDRGINSAGKVGTVSNSVCCSSTTRLYAGSTITANDGYLYSYAFWRVQPTSSTSSSERIAFKRSESAGTVVTVPEDCYALISCIKSDSSAIPSGTTAAEFAETALSVSLYNEEVKTIALRADATAADAAAHLSVHNADIDTLARHVVWPQNIAIMAGMVSGRLQDDETIAESDSYYTSVYFAIKPSTTYILKTSNTTIHLYDFNKTPLSIIQPGTGGTFTTPASAVYARMTSNASAWQINEGTTILDYTTGHLPLLIADEQGNQSAYFKGELAVYPANLSGWYEVINTDYSTHSFGHDTKYADVIALFDALVTAGDGYVTKENIGTAEGTDGSGNAYTIWAYTFKGRDKTHAKKTVQMPKLMMDASIHGFEKNSTYAVYALCYDLVHNWEQSAYLAELHNHVELKIVPVSNPWGFDNDSRNNYNGVNLNRNFPSKNWELVTPSQSASDASGLTGPLDQAEAQALSAWIQANPDMLMYYNIHTNGHYYAASYAAANYCMVSSDSEDEYYLRLFDAICRHIEDQTANISAEFNTAAPTYDQFIGTIHTSEDGSEEDDGDVPEGVIRGTVKQYVSSYLHLALSMTFELFNGLKIDEDTIFGVHSADSIKACAEMLTDMIAKTIVEYSE